MAQTIQTVLTRHFPNHGTSKKTNKPYTRHDFKTADGTKFQTFDAALGNKAYGLLNQPVEIDYESEPRGEYVNNTIIDIRVLEGAAAEQATATAAAEVAARPVEYQRRKHPTEEIQIHRQSALDRAISTVAAGIAQVKTLDDLTALSDRYVDYFVNGRQTTAAPSGAVIDEAPRNDSVGF